MPHEIVWTRQAREDLREIRAFIARDAPATASIFVRRLRHSVERLRMFPLSGHVVPELGREDIREFLKGNYRIIYRAAEHRIEILTIYHSARLLDESDM
jgi:toxin ParE1/3/4